MRRASIAAATGLTLMLFAFGLGACGDDDSSNNSTPGDANRGDGLTSGSVGAGKSLRSGDGRLEVRSNGKASFDVSLKTLEGGPGAPQGWSLVAPVYDITARDRGGAVTKLSQPFDLRLKADAGPVTIMYFDGKNWVIVESEWNDDGTLTATVDHLTPYSAAKPASGSSGTKPSVTATLPTVPAPTGTIGRPSVTIPAASPALTRTVTGSGTGVATAFATAPPFTPGANATVSASVTQTSGSAAAAALKTAVEKYKGKSVKVTGATGYTGSGSVALPAALQAAVSAAASGELYYGLYSGVNEALTTGGTSGGASGSLTVLIEPKTTFPGSAADALNQLKALFPGVGPVTYTTGTSSPTAYTFYYSAGGTAYVVGYVQYEGVPLAYLAAGSGSYASAALGTKDVK